MSSNHCKTVEVVEFNERFCGRKKIKNQKTVHEAPLLKKDSVEKGEEENCKVFNIKRARYELMRFAVNGFQKERKKQDKIAMAIRLGAKPPKKEYKNYKELMAEKLKAKEEKEVELPNKYTIQKLKGRKNTKKNRKKKDQPSSLL
ncbi:uncharacterized protein C1orf131 homolog [Parasteatoda tepidariorum]|uniref:uncharacterized protein C1orf131 homolog n=1 Tax=Parasteatoda tepidariorum TaxID=114398 RepID=UPI00077FB4B9|nr:uncharacterized protein C1orf131 homolog [Parasteatoda tepidariorum]